MANDVWTVIWKEWKELIARSTQTRSDTIKTIVVLTLILGIIVWRASFVMTNLGALFVPSFILIQLLVGSMADAFAGERERHTLETLLASRLSDSSILIGKILAGVFLVWGLMLTVVGLGLLGSVLRNTEIAPQFSAGQLSAILGIYLLLCLAMSCAAALVSLRASTVRQAIQTLTWSLMIVFFLGMFAMVRIPPEWRVTLMRVLAGENLVRTEIVLAAVLAGLTLLFFSLARLRFQRARLILD